MTRPARIAWARAPWLSVAAASAWRVRAHMAELEREAPPPAELLDLLRRHLENLARVIRRERARVHCGRRAA